MSNGYISDCYWFLAGTSTETAQAQRRNQQLMEEYEEEIQRRQSEALKNGLKWYLGYL